MATALQAQDLIVTREDDERVFFHGVSWAQYEALLAMRGERSIPRITYLEGELELMSPSIHHELIKKAIARLVEAFAEESGLSLNGYGSWTVKRARRKRGAEADECYVLGTQKPTIPDLAIEVVWTEGGIDKLEVWRGLGVREVWMWRRGRIEVHRLRGDRYASAPKSELLPDLDLAKVAELCTRPDQTEAVREYRTWLRRRRRSSR